MSFFGSRNTARPTRASSDIIKGRFDRSPDAEKALKTYRTTYDDHGLVVAKVVGRSRGTRQHLGYMIVPRSQVNRYGEVNA